ncbi:hypothetical protein [Klebsiella variicola]|uniref:hypothetical protein n=1 Tax=Klebsiella variicola TaxID=244366 RepID=UPI0012ABC0FD|nr:hypothetical protein [Klebsiella variicola]
MEKQHSLIFLIKNKTIALIVLFLMKITRTLRVRALAWYAGGKINYQHTKALLNLASATHHFSIRLLRFISLPAL